MHRLIATALLLLLLGLPAAAADKPNVLFIAIDDLRPELACYGSPVAVTPNLDALADEGLLFERAYCNFAVCGASRASLFSGLYPLHRKRFTSYKTRLDDDAPGVTTLPQVFKDAGYTTLSNGKIFHHINDIAKRSWSEPAWVPVGGEERGVYSLLPETTAKLSEKGRGYIVEKADVPDNAYREGQLAEKVIADLGRLKEDGKPFFLACGFVRPHLPFYAPTKYWDLYDADKIPLANNRYFPKGAPESELKGSTEYASYYLGDLEVGSDQWHRTMKHGYLACVSYVDKLVGDVLQALDKQGLTDNTIVVVWGDHGFHLGEHDFWGKHNTMDLSTRIPLIIRLPEAMRKQTAGVKTRAMVESVDIFPTLTDLAGLNTPDTVQGKAFTKLFRDPNAKHRSSILTRRGNGDTVITDDFAYTRYADRKLNPTANMLYDHRTDRAENTSVADDPAYADIVSKLDALLTKRMQEADQN